MRKEGATSTTMTTTCAIKISERERVRKYPGRPRLRRLGAFFRSTSEFAFVAVFSVRPPVPPRPSSVARTYFQFAMQVSYSTLARSFLPSFLPSLYGSSCRRRDDQHAMQSPPPPPSPPAPLLPAKKVDFRQVRDSMLCTIMRAAAADVDTPRPPLVRKYGRKRCSAMLFSSNAK